MSEPIVDIFVTTYGADAEWFRYLARSARKFASGFRDLVVVCPPDTGIEIDCQKYGCRLLTVPHEDPGHMQQQVFKAHADQFCQPGADWICFLDSDCVFIRPTNVYENLFPKGDRPIFCYDTWEADHTYQWRAGTEAFMQMGSMEYNMMRRMGMCFKPEHLKGYRTHLHKLYGNASECIMDCWDRTKEWFPARGETDRHWQPFGKPTASEFCAMGWWAWKNAHNDFHWWNVYDFGWPGGIRDAFVKQYWSHHGVDHYRDELETLLS